MLFGIGNDIIEIVRIKKARNNHPGFLKKIYTHKELAYCLSSSFPDERLAGRFAAKEAVAKAIGSALSWHDVEILPDGPNRPIVNLYGKAAELTVNMKIHVSISHCKEYANAIAILEIIS